jgi:type I restriction enzyme S subunit
MQFYDESANPHFIRLFLESRYDELRAVGQGGGSTKGALTCGFLKSYCVPLPKKPKQDRSEQDEIVRILMAIEEKTRVHSRKAETLRQLFNTLLHKLMTGEICVADLEIDVSEVTQ